MSPFPSHRLQVTAAEAAKLTSEQEKFNTLTQRIAKERDLLRDWEAVNNPADLKPWLKADRENQRRMERAMRCEFNPFF